MTREEIIKQFANLGRTWEEVQKEMIYGTPVNSLTLSSWQDFEIKARKAIEEELGVQLPSETVNINGKMKNFDLVNKEHFIVGDIKNYKKTAGGNRPSAKISILNEYVWLMQLLEKYDNRKWKKLFVVGEDFEMLNAYLQEFDKWLGDVEFYFFSSDSGLKKMR